MKDADITFTEDAPRTAPDDWADAIAHRGLPMPERKEQIALRVTRMFSAGSGRRAQAGKPA